MRPEVLKVQLARKIFKHIAFIDPVARGLVAAA